MLVLLFEKDGELRVLLTTRAKTLRTHPGQTALPGGGKDEEDDTVVDTAVSDIFIPVRDVIDVPHASNSTVRRTRKSAYPYATRPSTHCASSALSLRGPDHSYL